MTNRMERESRAGKPKRQQHQPPATSAPAQAQAHKSTFKIGIEKYNDLNTVLILCDGSLSNTDIITVFLSLCARCVRDKNECMNSRRDYSRTFYRLLLFFFLSSRALVPLLLLLSLFLLLGVL